MQFTLRMLPVSTSRGEIVSSEELTERIELTLELTQEQAEALQKQFGLCDMFIVGIAQKS